MSLLDRCREFVLLSTHSGEDLRDFVLIEIGRAGADQLSDSSGLVLYFADDGDRKEFIEMVIQAKGMISRKWP